MAQIPSLYENDTSRKKNSLIQQWSEAIKSRNINRMATVLRYAAKFAYSIGNQNYAIILVDQALQILPLTSPLRVLTFQDFRVYTSTSGLLSFDFPVSLNTVNQVIALI